MLHEILYRKINTFNSIIKVHHKVKRRIFYMVNVYHVAKTGSDLGRGTKEDPFLTINKAASVAVAGDTIIVHEGEYREWVKPKNPGLDETRRITYQAAEGEMVV